VTDRTYVALANAQCAKTLSGLRPQDAGPFGTTVTPVQAADGIDKAAVGLDGLATTLRALPLDPTNRPYIDGWLDGWQRYAGLGHQYAAFLRAHGTANPGRPLSDSITREASAADHFALANGLKSCTFTTAPVEDPSNGF
jgi:hypothetical protein